MREYPDLGPRDGTDAAQDIAAAISARSQRTSATFKGEAKGYLTDPNYSTLRLRLETAAVEAVRVEARRRVRLNESR